MNGANDGVINNTKSNIEECSTKTAESQDTTSRPKRNAKPSMKSIENHLQSEHLRPEKLWEKV